MPFVARKLDYMLISFGIIDKTTDCHSVSVPTPDLRGCLTTVKPTDIVKGR